MITAIRGVLREKTAGSAVVECNGLSYEVFAPFTVTERLPAAGEEVFLLTEFVVREQSHALYGFFSERERQLFRQLMKTSGVGAKTALAMMSASAADELITALSSEDVGRLARTPGIGAKTAERLVIDFRGSTLLLKTAPSETDTDVEQALATLGYKKAEIKKALSQLGADAGADTASRIRAALRVLSGR